MCGGGGLEAKCQRDLFVGLDVIVGLHSYQKPQCKVTRGWHGFLILGLLSIISVKKPDDPYAIVSESFIYKLSSVSNREPHLCLIVFTNDYLSTLDKSVLTS